MSHIPISYILRDPSICNMLTIISSLKRIKNHLINLFAPAAQLAKLDSYQVSQVFSDIPTLQCWNVSPLSVHWAVGDGSKRLPTPKIILASSVCSYHWAKDLFIEQKSVSFGAEFFHCTVLRSCQHLGWKRPIWLEEHMSVLKRACLPLKEPVGIGRKPIIFPFIWIG